MPQKKAKIVCGSARPAASAICSAVAAGSSTFRPATSGKRDVSAAAKTQCVALPTDCPSPRAACGKISEMNTQITAPCPTAWAAMNANRHAGTMSKLSLANAHEHSPSDAT